MYALPRENAVRKNKIEFACQDHFPRQDAPVPLPESGFSRPIFSYKYRDYENMDFFVEIVAEG